MTRRDILDHLFRTHDYDWRGDEAETEGRTSPDPLGWHRSDGGYIFTSAEAFTIHRALHEVGFK